MNIKISKESKDGENFLIAKDKNNSISFEYKPSLEDIWSNLNLESFIFIQLDNPYLNLESNVFNVKLEGLPETCGWIFPISVLESDQTKKKETLLNYVYVGFNYLLTQIEELVINKNRLSDYYTDNLILCVLHKETVSKIGDFNIKEYLLSFYTYGYSLYNKQMSALPVKSYNKHNEYKEKQHIKILKSNYYHNVEFVNNLINGSLTNCTDALVRFILLYQIIEFIISNKHQSEFDSLLAAYQNSDFTKNDFVERIKEISREKYMIDKIIKEDTLDSNICLNFKNECKSIFNDIDYKYNKDSLPSLLYSFRNQITHSYRSFLGKENNLVKTIECFESVIFNLIIKLEAP